MIDRPLDLDSVQAFIRIAELGSFTRAAEVMRTTQAAVSLKLKVNQEKSKVSRPTESTLLGFSFYNDKGTWQIRVASKTLKRLKEKCKKITQRNNGNNTRQKITALKAVIEGWVN